MFVSLCAMLCYVFNVRTYVMLRYAALCYVLLCLLVCMHLCMYLSLCTHACVNVSYVMYV